VQLNRRRVHVAAIVPAPPPCNRLFLAFFGLEERHLTEAKRQ
jgi:hypothetical protein